MKRNAGGWASLRGMEVRLNGRGYLSLVWSSLDLLNWVWYRREKKGQGLLSLGLTPCSLWTEHDGRHCNPSTPEIHSGRSEVQGFFQLHSEFKAILGYMRPTQKKKGEGGVGWGRRGRRTKVRASLESKEGRILGFGPKQWEAVTTMEIGLVTYSSTQSQQFKVRAVAASSAPDAVCMWEALSKHLLDCSTTMASASQRMEFSGR